MVVLQINKFFYERGGSERYFFALSDALSTRGHSVVHFSMAHPRNVASPWAGYFVSERRYEDGGRITPRDAIEVIRSREAAERIRALIAHVRPDVAHVHNIYHQLTPSIVIALRDRGIPTVMTLHDYKLICPSYAMFARGGYCFRCKGGRYYHAIRERCSGGSLARSTLLAAEAYVQRQSGAYEGIGRFLTPSRFMYARMSEGGISEDRLEYLPAFVGGEDDPGGALSPPGWPSPGYVVYVGRLSREKGLDVLIGAARRLPERQFLVCGDGPDAAHLRSMAENLENVYFSGHLPRDQVQTALRNAGVAVMPTLSPENAPFAVLEASLAGCPVVVSESGGLPELVEIVGGRVATTGNVAALAAAIEETLADPESREGAAFGRSRMREHFDRERHLERIETIYTELIGGVRAA